MKHDGILDVRTAEGYAIACAMRGPDHRHSDTTTYAAALDRLKLMTAGVVRFLIGTGVCWRGTVSSPAGAQLAWEAASPQERDEMLKVKACEWHYMSHAYDALALLDPEYYRWLRGVLQD